MAHEMSKRKTLRFTLLLLCAFLLPIQMCSIPIIASDTTVQKCDFLSSPSIVTEMLKYIGIILTAVLGIVIAICLYGASNVGPINKEVFDRSNTSSIGSRSSSFYGNQSHSFDNVRRSPNLSGNESLVYGDTSLVSPHKRSSRRYL